MAGRPKGSPNKVTQLFRERLEAAGFDLVSEGIKLYNELTREDMKVKCYEILVSYAHSKPKPLDDDPGDSQNSTLGKVLRAIPTEALLKAMQENQDAASTAG